MANWDAIVIGLGGVGSAATYHLAAAGHRVLGIDRFPPPHDQGSSHGKTRIIRQAYFEHPAYVPLLRRAYELWDELQQRANSQLFYRTGLVEVGPQDGIVIPGVLRSAAERGLSIEQLSAGEMTQRWPGFPCFFHETPAGFFYGFPSVNGGGVKVARHSGGQPLDEPDATHARDEDDRKLVDNYIETCLPGVGKMLIEQTGCYYTMTPDEHFILDSHPEHPEVIVIAGLSGHGFKFTSVLGEIASKLAMSQRSKFDIDLFRIDRKRMTNVQ